MVPQVGEERGRGDRDYSRVVSTVVSRRAHQRPLLPARRYQGGTGFVSGQNPRSCSSSRLADSRNQRRVRRVQAEQNSASDASERPAVRVSQRGNHNGVLAATGLSFPGSRPEVTSSAGLGVKSLRAVDRRRYRPKGALAQTLVQGF